MRFLIKTFRIAIVIVVFLNFGSSAQQLPINGALLKGEWPASWISCAGVPQRDYGIYHFRKSFNIEKKPGHFIIHVSADNRYRLFVNGEPVSSGPARGDKFNWYFETLDISTWLKPGKNVIAAKVWNMGIHAPVAQISDQTAFVVQGDSGAEAMVNTDGSYKVMSNLAYTPVSLGNGARLDAYMVIGPGDKVDGSKYPWGWEQPEYDDSKWLSPVPISHPVTSGYGTDNIWTLSPRNIPQMEERLERITTVRRTSGVKTGPDFLKGKQPLTIPANSKVSILLDQSFNTVAYPEVLVSGGKGSSITLTYTEALLDDKKEKGNRNEIDNKTVIGNYDIFEPDGGKDRLFRPLWFRTYRYIQVDIVTKNEALLLSDVYGKYTGYPFEQRASFSSNDKSMKELWDVSWRTARLCAGETYFDCPYYEQLQYEGDTRIQALISLYVAGDDRLMRKSMLDFQNSRVPEGLTQGRYPSNRIQVIPPYSLFWISMVHDYWMYRRDDEFVKGFMTGVKGVLDWYEHRIDTKKGMLGPMKWWNFVDYTDVFSNGVPDGATDGNSSVITLQYIYTLRQAVELYSYFGDTALAGHYQKLADELSLSTYKACFDENRNVMANTPEHKKFSQHAGILAILGNVIPKDREAAVMDKLLHDKTLGQATFYFRFYLIQAMKKTGMGDLYYSELKPWRDMLKVGLTTFAEKPEPARSDCHAWSASPSYDFLATICGVSPASPGFKTVQIKPAFGELTEVNAKMPHPDGEISVRLKRKGKNGLEGTVVIPDSLSGKFIWQGKTLALKGGMQKVNFPGK
nr:alpha-L-rhamnosidase C-terminal domain-containing protein [Pedobacter panaciterrae]